MSKEIKVGDFVEIHGNNHIPTNFVGLGTVVEILSINKLPRSVYVNIQDTTDCEYIFGDKSLEKSKELLLTYDRWIVDIEFVHPVPTISLRIEDYEEFLADLGDIDDPSF